MLTKVLTLVLVVLFSLALADEQARYLYAHTTGVDVSGAVNIHHAGCINASSVSVHKASSLDAKR